MQIEKLTTPDAIEKRADYYEKWADDIRALNGTSVDADHSAETAAVLRALTRGLEEAKTLVALALDRLEDVDDVGPRDEGWQSAELMEWIAKARDLSRAQPGQDELLAREPIEGAAEHGNEE